MRPAPASSARDPTTVPSRGTAAGRRSINAETSAVPTPRPFQPSATVTGLHRIASFLAFFPLPKINRYPPFATSGFRQCHTFVNTSSAPPGHLGAPRPAFLHAGTSAGLGTDLVVQTPYGDS